MPRILSTFTDTQASADKAYRFFRRANVLSKATRIKRGWYKFELHVPAKWSESAARAQMAAAFRDNYCEAFTMEEIPLDVVPERFSPTPAEAVRSENPNVIFGARSLMHRGDTITIEFRSNAEAQAFFNRHTIAGN